jgi:hypothetical protein
MDSGNWFGLHEAEIINWRESPGSDWIINFSQKLLFLLSVLESRRDKLSPLHLELELLYLS